MAEAIFGPDDFVAATHVSRETLSRLKTYLSMLEDWNARHNLVSDASLKDAWRRHFLDSAQLAPLVPHTATSMVDLGSGAGFPGLVLAEFMRERPGFRSVLYEATGKKIRFLDAVASRLGLKVELRNMRIESAKPEAFDVVTARALAPLPRLLPYAQRFWGPHTIGLFLKSQNVGPELTESLKCWRMRLGQHLSLSDSSGLIIEVRELRRGKRNPTA
jgi:16S rRNA (guanine527-N7)-methyltransferase